MMSDHKHTADSEFVDCLSENDPKLESESQDEGDHQSSDFNAVPCNTTQEAFQVQLVKHKSFDSKEVPSGESGIEDSPYTEPLSIPLDTKNEMSALILHDEKDEPEEMETRATSSQNDKVMSSTVDFKRNETATLTVAEDNSEKLLPFVENAMRNSFSMGAEKMGPSFDPNAIENWKLNTNIQQNFKNLSDIPLTLSMSVNQVEFGYDNKETGLEHRENRNYFESHANEDGCGEAKEPAEKEKTETFQFNWASNDYGIKENEGAQQRAEKKDFVDVGDDEDHHEKIPEKLKEQEQEERQSHNIEVNTVKNQNQTTFETQTGMDNDFTTGKVLYPRLRKPDLSPEKQISLGHNDASHGITISNH